MKSKYIIIIAFCAIFHNHLLKAQSSNSTTGGFMSHVNSWISRIRGHQNNSNNHNNHNQNNSEKDKESDNKSNQQIRPMPFPGMMPYPMMPGLYSPMQPMSMPFGPRPIPANAFAPAMPFGSLAAGSSLGPNLSPNMGPNMVPNMGPNMGPSIRLVPNPSIGSPYGQIRPSFTSASHMMPAHHNYHDSSQDYPLGYGMGNTFGNGFSGLSDSNYGSLGGGHPVNHQSDDNQYEGEQEPNNGEEYSGYHR